MVYPCTALLLLCLFSTIITYILNHRWVLLAGGEAWWKGQGCTQDSVTFTGSFPVCHFKILGDGEIINE